MMFQLRYLQTLNSISAENNSTIVFPVPIDIMSSFMPPATGKESILSWMMGCIILFLSAIVVTVQNAEYFACCYQLSNVDPRNNPWNMLQTARRFEFDILISARNCCICITLMQMTGNKKLLLNQWEQKWWWIYLQMDLRSQFTASLSRPVWHQHRGEKERCQSR